MMPHRTLPTAALGPVLLCAAVLTAAGCPSDDLPSETTVVSATEATDTNGAETTDAETTAETTAAETTTGTDATDTGDTTGPAVCEPLPAATDDCCCFSTYELQQGFGVYITNDCPAESLCGSLQIECPTGPDCPIAPKAGGDGELAVSDEAALECILTALRDGTQGTLTWTYTSTSTPGYAQYEQTVHVLADRRVLYSVLDVIDLGGEWSDVTRETLLPAEDFDACLQGADLPTQLSCLLQPTDDQVIEVCTEGGTYSEF